MKPAPFDYFCPETLEETLPLLAKFGEDALILSGGLSLGAMLNMRIARPQVVIDINRVDGLANIIGEAEGLKIGAMVRQEELARSSICQEVTPLLAEGLLHVGHYQTRSRGTIGGSIAHADPSAEIPLCVMTLGGQVELSSLSGIRKVAAEDFFCGALVTVRNEDEMVTAVFCPRQKRGTGVAFEELSERKGDFAIVAAAALARYEGGRLIGSMGLGGVEDRPAVMRLSNIEPDEKLIDHKINDFVQSLNTLEDKRASGVYRRQLAAYLGKKVLKTAIKRCHHETH